MAKYFKIPDITPFKKKKLISIFRFSSRLIEELQTRLKILDKQNESFRSQLTEGQKDSEDLVCAPVVIFVALNQTQILIEAISFPCDPVIKQKTKYAFK